MLCEYALNKYGDLVHVEDVPNGKNSECHCPYCGEPMIAKNGGKVVEHHFAHFSGSECKGYEETVLHLLAKEIIAEEKCVMLPEYRTLASKLVQFENVEIEERNDSKSIQPDIVGVTKDGLRLHIEIFVTHRIDEDKKQKLISGEFNCLEIQIPKNFGCNKNKFKDFLINSTERRWFINYPYGDEKQKPKYEILKLSIETPMHNGRIINSDISKPKFSINTRIINRKTMCQFKIVEINQIEKKYIVLNNIGNRIPVFFENENEYIDFGKPSNEWTEIDWQEFYGRTKFAKS